jgi:hypothetical protein
MIVKKTKQLGNFKKGINLYVPTRRRVSAAPSGIPVATTNEILISDNTFYWGYNTYYYRQGSAGNYYYEFGNSSLQFTEGSWVLIDVGDGYFDFRDATQTNPNVLPFTGWGGRITITAA